MLKGERVCNQVPPDAMLMYPAWLLCFCSILSSQTWCETVAGLPGMEGWAITSLLADALSLRDASSPVHRLLHSRMPGE